jgi:hypothetical protein
MPDRHCARPTQRDAFGEPLARAQFPSAAMGASVLSTWCRSA